MNYAHPHKQKPLWAEIEVYKIPMYVPDDLIKKWAENDVVDCDGSVTIPGNETLFFLLEKDPVFLDQTDEDQGDNYANPKQIG
jgi:hypothetical protein